RTTMRAETNQPGTHVDDRSCLTRRLPVTAQAARVGETITSRILFASPGRGAVTGGFSQLLRDVGAVAGGLPRSFQDIGRFRQLLDRRSAGAGRSRRGCLSRAAAFLGVFFFNDPAATEIYTLSLSAVLPAAE